MVFVPVPNTVEAEIRVTSQGQKCENTLWFEFAAAPGVVDLTDLGADLLSWWTTYIAPNTSSVVQLREILLRDMSSPTALQHVTVPLTALFGSNTPNIMPGNVTMSISFRTALRGRSFRGRNYAIGITEDQCAGNSFVAGLTATWAAAYAPLLDPANVSGSNWVIASRFSGVDPTTKKPIPRATGVTTPVTAVNVVDDNVDAMRRRLTGRGQ